MTKRRHFNYVGSEEDSNPLRLGRRDTGGSTRTTDHSFMKLKTIDEVCNQPPGTFKKYVAEQEEQDRRREAELRDRIRKFKKEKQNLQ